MLRIIMIKIMKKQLLFLPLLLTLIAPLSSCGNTTSKVDIKYGQMINNEVTTIDYLTLKGKMENKDNFILAVYSNGCACWSNFKKVATEYIKKTHIQIYAVEYSSFRTNEGKSLDNFSLTFVSGGVSLHIIQDGKKKSEIADSKSLVISKIEAFTNYLEENITLPKMFYVSLSQVDSLYKSEETSLIYFARSNCADCQYLDNNFLKTYKLTANMYILDCEALGIREYDDNGSLTEESALKWKEFKEKYGLAETKNAKFGYGEGYVPTLFLLKGNASNELPDFLSGAVYFNDEVAKDDNGYYISNSYYTSERIANLSYTTTVIKNKRLETSEVTTYLDYAFWSQESAAKVHDPIIKAFLDEALTKVTHEGFNSEN